MTFDHRLSLTGVFCQFFFYRESSSQLQLGLDLLAPFLDQGECKSTIHWLCDYITYQANKKAIHHSRDLHSMIVAAFSCLQSWIMSHPWLLDSQVTKLTDVMTDLTIIRQSVIAWISLSVCLFAVSVEQAVSQLVSQLYSIFHSISVSVCPSVSQSFSQSVGQSVCQSVNLSVNQCVSLSVILSVNQGVSLSVSQSIFQSIGVSVCQSASQSCRRSMSQSLYQSVSSPVSVSLCQQFGQSVIAVVIILLVCYSVDRCGVQHPLTN